MTQGLLSVVATPIGNLGDLSPRAVQALTDAELVLCEDTRHTATLMRHLGLHRPLRSLHAHNETDQIPRILQELAEGRRIALVSDAGTPCLSDPGARLIDAVQQAGERIESIPGPFAAAVALAASGFAPIPFAFWGFLAKKAGERRTELRARLRPGPDGQPMTHAFYVPGRDLREFVADLAEVAPVARVDVARELTKIHEGHLRGTPVEVDGLLLEEMLRGEAVVLVEVGAASTPLSEAEAHDPAELVRKAREAGRDRKQALRDIGQVTGLSRKALYSLWVSEGGAEGDAGD